MATIYDYLTYYKEIPFSEYPFNEIDNILFSELSYLNWENIIPTDQKQISLQEASLLFFKQRESKQKKKESPFLKANIENLKIIQDSLRYKNCKLSYYRNNLDQKKQFGALCIHLNPRTVYVSFEGTDTSLIGWKEDFCMSYRFPIDSQQEAIQYLNEVIHWTDKIVYVGGHSKGGNLAMSAAMYCKKSIERKIKTVFNNDGPGFKTKQFSSKEYQRMLTKLKMYTPEESIIGMLLLTAPTYQVVKSKEKGIKQHDCNTWECFGTFFVKGTLSKTSQKLDDRIMKWLQKYSDEEREKMVITFFDILEKSNIKSLDGIRSLEWNQVVNIIKNMKTLDTETKKLYLTAFKRWLVKEKDAH